MNYFYYSEDKKVFHSKLHALYYSKQNNKRVWFYYYDDIWSNLDWSIEPTQSLNYYYKDYAQKIRDEYDYVILCYSGWYDSSNILETFYYNQIPLDKIIIVGAFSQDSSSGVDENHNGELYHNAFPLIQTLGLSNITETFDYSKLFNDMNNFTVYHNEDWFHQIQGFYSPHNWFWCDLEKYVVPNSMKDKKVAILFGKDKPKYEDGKFWFSDNACLSYAYGANPVENIRRINFYWEPEYPWILLKQVHTLKNTKSRFTNLEVDRIVYNLKHPILFKSPKSPNCVLSLRDEYLKDNQNTKLFDYFKLSAERINSFYDIHSVSVVISKYYTL